MIIKHFGLSVQLNNALVQGLVFFWRPRIVILEDKIILLERQMTAPPQLLTRGSHGDQG